MINVRDMFGDTWNLVQSNWVTILIWSGVVVGLIAAVWAYRIYFSKSRAIKAASAAPKPMPVPSRSLWSYISAGRNNRGVANPPLPPANPALKAIDIKADKSLMVLGSMDIDGSLVGRNYKTGELNYYRYAGYSVNFKDQPHLAPVFLFHKDARFGQDKYLILTFDRQFAVVANGDKSVSLKPIAQVKAADAWACENVTINKAAKGVMWKSNLGYLKTTGSGQVQVGASPYFKA